MELWKMKIHGPTTPHSISILINKQKVSQHHEEFQMPTLFLSNYPLQ